MKNSKQNESICNAEMCEARRQAVLALSKDELIEKYSKTIKKAVRKCVWDTGADASVDFDDFYQIGCMAVVKVQDKYNGASEFSTYIFACVINAVRKYIKTIKKHMDFNNRILVDDESFYKMLDYDDEKDKAYIAKDGEFYDPFEDELNPLYGEDGLFCAVRKIYEKSKPATKRNIEALIMRAKDYSIEEIASTLGSSKDQASNYISAGKKFLAEKEEIKKFTCA